MTQARKAKALTYLRWGIEAEGKLVELNGVPDLFQTRAGARKILRADKHLGALPQSARVVRLQVTVKVV